MDRTMKCWSVPRILFLAAGVVLLVGETAVARHYIGHGKKSVFGGPTGIRLYKPQPYRSPLYQPKKPIYKHRWKTAPGTNPWRQPRRQKLNPFAR